VCTTISRLQAINCLVDNVVKGLRLLVVEEFICIVQFFTNVFNVPFCPTPFALPSLIASLPVVRKANTSTNISILAQG
jgi:hypothetical protein